MLSKVLRFAETECGIALPRGEARLMPTMQIVSGFRIMILTNDHPHVVGRGGRAKVELDCTNGGAELLWFEGITRPDLRRIIEAIEGDIERLCSEWRKVHGQT